MSLTTPPVEPTVTYAWPHLKWVRVQGGYRCQACGQKTTTPTLFSCPGKRQKGGK